MDYDGTRSSNSEGSVNYSIQEYVNDSISTLVDVSDKNGIPHPNIITAVSYTHLDVYKRQIIYKVSKDWPIFISTVIWCRKT